MPEQSEAGGRRRLISMLLVPLLMTLILPADPLPLDAAVQQKIAGFAGNVSIYAKNLQTGASYSLRGDEPVRTASTIKLAVLVECFAENAEGKLNLSDLLTLAPEEKVFGSGILQDFSDGDRLPVRDYVTAMIVLSDNTATNIVLNRVGGNAVNARMASLGFTETRVMRKILGDRNKLKGAPSGVTTEGANPDNRRWGIGRSSPHEMVRLLDMLYHGQLVSPAASADMLAILKKQRDHNGLGRNDSDITIASKSGALDALRSDVGILYNPHGDVAIAITIDGMPKPDWSPDNPGSLLIAALGNLITTNLATK